MLRHGTGAFELLIVGIVFQGSVNMLGVVHSITVTIVQVLEWYHIWFKSPSKFSLLFCA